MRYSHDDRRVSYCDVMPEIGKGDINISIIEPQTSIFWHRHKHQADYQLVVKGSLKIGICNMPNTNDPVTEEREDLINEWCHEYYDIYDKNYLEAKKYKYDCIFPNHFDKTKDRCDWFYLSERNACNGPLYIPTGLWHGCHNYTNEPAILIYHITTKWDGTDEDRCSPEILDWPYERVVK